MLVVRFLSWEELDFGDVFDFEKNFDKGESVWQKHALSFRPFPIFQDSAIFLQFYQHSNLFLKPELT